MQVSKTYDYEKNDHINRANMALICSEFYGIKDVSPSLYKIAAPASEIPFSTKEGEFIYHRSEIEEAIPWYERSMKTFGVVYRYEVTASFIGMDGKTYIVPNDKPVLDHLESCGYIIAPYGKNLDGSTELSDSLIFKVENKNLLSGYEEIDKNLPADVIQQIDEMEMGRGYRVGYCPYDGTLTFGGTFGLHFLSDDEFQLLSMSERKLANIKTYGRVFHSQDIEEYVQYALGQSYLNDAIFNEKYICNRAQ